MGLIKFVLMLAMLAIIVVFGYWLYATFASAPDDKYWVQINTHMPEPLRRFSCEQTRKRAGSAPLVSCDGT